QRGGTWTRTLSSPDNTGSQAFLRDYMTDTDTDGWTLGDGDQNGYGFEFLSSDMQDNQIPDQPVITYIGTNTFPVNDLRFQTSAFSDPQGTNTFAALSWRIAEIANPSTTNFNPAKPWKYEITAEWQSLPISNVNNQIRIPSDNLKTGRTYRVRVRMKDNTERWSHWSDPIEFVSGPANNLLALNNNLRVTEVMYNATPGSDFDFIEFHNANTSLVLNLSGVLITEGIDYTFPPDTFLGPGQYIVVAKQPGAAFDTYYGTNAAPVLGPYSQNLNNGGENVRVEPPGGGEPIIDFEYAGSRGWPVSPDGAGHSLIPLIMTNQTNGRLDYGLHWRASAYIAGSPGEADPRLAESVVLNEFAAHTDNFNPSFPLHDSDDWIELYNKAAGPISLAGWYLSDDPDDLMKWAIPTTNSVGPGGWISFDETTGFHNPLSTGFGLDKAGERIFLSHLPGTAEDRVVDSVRFKGQENGPTLGRYDNGEFFWYTQVATRNGSNVLAQQDLVIQEVMYHPAPTTNNPPDNTADEFIAIHNPTPSAQSLTN
ncbi:MAG: lamin tail domain-containing protein, partial [Verrucomicrobiota bacterium]